MPITMNPELEARLRARAEAEGLTVDAYVDGLLREEDAQIAHTEALLQEATDSGEHVELTEQEWDRLEQEAVADVEVRSKRHA
jgi:hypothetical protein